jgi:hypothetical protein
MFIDTSCLKKDDEKVIHLKDDFVGLFTIKDENYGNSLFFKSKYSHVTCIDTGAYLILDSDINTENIEVEPICYEEIIQLIEKSKPKKIILKELPVSTFIPFKKEVPFEHKEKFYFCPTCNKMFIPERDNCGQKYCDCGQLLDWNLFD